MYDAEGKQTWSVEYGVYGKIRKQVAGGAVDCPFRYQGQYEDGETGLYYNRFRFYDPNDGVYLSPDPIRIKGGIRQYAYVRSPIRYVDPKGLTQTPAEGIIMTGNAQNPRGPRPNIDIPVDENAMVKSQADVEWPKGQSSFISPEAARDAGLTGQFHSVKGGIELPEGIGIIADGADVGGPNPAGHHTLYPTRDMPFEEFQEKIANIESKHAGKITDKGEVKLKCP